MPTNPDEVIRIKNEIETLLNVNCRRHDGYRWHRVADTFCLTSQSSSRLQFTLSSYMNDKAFILNSINQFFNSSQEPIVGQSATITTLDEQSNIFPGYNDWVNTRALVSANDSTDDIQWVHHQLPWEDRDGFLIHNVGGYANGKSISPDLITLVRDVICPINYIIGRTLYYSFTTPTNVRIQDTGQNPTRTLDMDIDLFSDNVLATRHIYRQLGLADYNQRSTWIPPAISPEPTEREIEPGHSIPDNRFCDFRIPDYRFPVRPRTTNAVIMDMSTVPTPSTCIEQEEALDTDYKDDLF